MSKNHSRWVKITPKWVKITPNEWNHSKWVKITPNEWQSFQKSENSSNFYNQNSDFFFFGLSFGDFYFFFDLISSHSFGMNRRFVAFLQLPNRFQTLLSSGCHCKAVCQIIAISWYQWKTRSIKYCVMSFIDYTRIWKSEIG